MNPQTRKPGYFTFLTLLAFHVFLKEHVTAAIIETGVGGEYDSTNIVSHPAVTVITTIGMDHVRALRRGSQENATIEDIAWHKAGIMKSGCPAVSTQQLPEVMNILHERAKEKAVELHVVDVYDEIRHLQLGTDGQNKNSSLALAATRFFFNQETDIMRQMPYDESLVAAIRGINQTRLRGRLHTLEDGKVRWYLDGAHNEDSLKEAANWFARNAETVYCFPSVCVNAMSDVSIVLLRLHTSSYTIKTHSGIRKVFSKVCSNSWK